MKVIAATNNKGKVKEIKAILGQINIEVISQSEAGIDIEVEENGTSFAENALIKARAINRITNLPVVADDSGLCVDSLGGAPGIYSARYAGEGATDVDRIEKLLSEMKGKENRDAHFTSAAAFVLNNDEEYVAEGNVYGKILDKPYGNGGFGYDPVFYSNELEKTFGEATEDEKNKISHRYRAFMKLKEILEKRLQGNRGDYA